MWNDTRSRWGEAPKAPPSNRKQRQVTVRLEPAVLKYYTDNGYRYKMTAARLAKMVLTVVANDDMVKGVLDRDDEEG